ncbi:hypothetical protein PsYK624_027190 [Phanerochaete sordida]|uniref:Altered inheritance of mitochondria protein 9, mitochondrial n=1 Tax=Phanerochaete sordida TaxID=48140 RepID=A0A9P3LA48_9APHY|nr:hypothetical protein PsYK624_027190 [Phanerochaete sordida]
MPGLVKSSQLSHEAPVPLSVDGVRAKPSVAALLAAFDRERTALHPHTPPAPAPPQSSPPPPSPAPRAAMALDGTHLQTDTVSAQDTDTPKKLPLTWSWELEHQDRKKEAQADAAVHGAPPFQVDRKLLKDIVQEKAQKDVARIQFLGAGTFHKGYLIILVDGSELVARVARRFMPRYKTESEVATMRYLRERTNIPVPDVYHYDANPFNRLGGEYILMSKAAGVPLSRVFHSMPHSELMQLMENLANMILPLYAHRFPKIGSLYLGPDPQPVAQSSSSAPTPTATNHMARTLSMTPVASQQGRAAPTPQSEFHVGPIISWPFFGSNRGELTEINRGPWPSTQSYLEACAEREVTGVRLENEGKTAPHRLHLDPDEIITSRHHKVSALTGDVSDQSDEWDWEESEAEWDGPGNRMYQDYRRMQRTTFLVAHLQEREEKVKEEMGRFIRMMERLGACRREQAEQSGPEEFTLDPHDLNLENVFVDEHDMSKITCIIDWESTTTRPLWAAAHVPAFLQTSPFTSKLFRATVEKLAEARRTVMVDGHPRDLSAIAAEWLQHESAGTRLRMAHRCIEWDGWEEGLVESILGPEEQEEDWFRTWADDEDASRPEPDGDSDATDASPASPLTSTSPTLTEQHSDGEDGSGKRRGSTGSQAAGGKRASVGAAAAPTAAPPRAAQPVKVVAVEKEKERILDQRGDICGGRGGELGRRLEAWLVVNGDGDGRVELPRRWKGDAPGGDDAPT